MLSLLQLYQVDQQLATVSADNTNGFVAFDGYGYFNEGANQVLSTGLLMSNNTIFRLNDIM